MWRQKKKSDLLKCEPRLIKVSLLRHILSACSVDDKACLLPHFILPSQTLITVLVGCLATYYWELLLKVNNLSLVTEPYIYWDLISLLSERIFTDCLSSIVFKTALLVFKFLKSCYL